MEHDIFISYSRKDTDIVDQFVNGLTEAGYSVWIDREGIYSGDQWKIKIVQAIKNSSIVVFFSSESSNSSEFTIKEINIALDQKKPIHPIRIDKATYAESIYFDLVDVHYIQYEKGRLSSNINQLITSVAKHLGKPEVIAESSSSTTTTTSTAPESGMSPEELYTLGEEHFENKEYDHALKYFRQAAKLGHAGAQYTLGLWYDSGQGVQKDLQQAIYWYRKAAEKGHDDAQNMLGFHYEIGLGVEEQDDYQLAVYWYRKAAEQGNEYAIRNLERLKKLKKI